MIRRGLTLLEVLAATVLLTVIAAACLPMLAEARRWADSVRDPTGFDELARLADRVMADPEPHDISHDELGTPGFSSNIDAGRDLMQGSPQVTIVVQPSHRDDAHHVWVRFDSGSHRVWRFIRLTEASER